MVPSSKPSVLDTCVVLNLLGMSNTATRRLGGCSARCRRAWERAAAALQAARSCRRARTSASLRRPSRRRWRSRTGTASRASAIVYSVRPGCFFECQLAPRQEEIQEQAQGHVAVPAAALVVTQAEQLLTLPS